MINLNEIFVFESGYSGTTLESPFLLSIEDINNGHNITNCDTGESQAIIFQSSISSLTEGDFVLIYDNDGLLNDDCTDLQYGAILLDGFVWDNTVVSKSLVGSIELCGLSSVSFPGFVSGNPVIIKVYDIIQNKLNNFCLVLEQGNGDFGDPLIVVSNLLLSEMFDSNNDGICD
tara:strand:- start:254 stop:775 length:522 start_codon:yes stop_codon:yes gene_type:complete